MAVSALVLGLQARLAEATSGEQKTRAVLRKAGRQTQRSRTTNCRRLDTAITIMVLQNGQIDAALRYCEQLGLDVPESRKRLEQHLLEGNMEDMVARLHPRTHLEKQMLARAERFWAQYQLATWVEARNEGEGVAPAYEHVFARMKDLQPAKAAAASSGEHVRHRSKIQWVRRFRHRWKGQHASIKSQRGHTEEELRKQAESRRQSVEISDFRTQNVVHFLGPETGLNFSPVALDFY